jgi:hydrogenase-4 membrane subunit HyfE
MTLPLIFCLIATVIPVFFSKISAAPTWLALQALALGWITITHFETLSVHASLVGLEVLLVRAVLVPHLLRRALRKQPNARISLMPTNLFAWIIAVMLIILAFKFGDGARADARAMTLGVVAATVVIAFLILATNHEPKAQLVALLFMENALALFETLMPEHWPLTVHLAMSTVYILTASVGSWLVGGNARPGPADAEIAREVP